MMKALRSLATYAATLIHPNVASAGFPVSISDADEAFAKTHPDSTTLPERMPYFYSPDCPAFVEDMDWQDQMELKLCAEQAMLTYIYNHLEYEAAGLPTKKRVPQHYKSTVSLVVEADGTISDVESPRPANATLDAEARRVIAGMPAWIPGVQAGKPVRLRITLPVNFSVVR